MNMKWIALFSVILNTIGGHAQTPPTLVPFKFQPLPLGSIKPQGWLLDQMQLMADGLAGHEHDFYRFVSDSSWLGGKAEYSKLNEGFPYWFNGIVPLAYGLDNDRLKDQVESAINKVLDLQADDGWLGPEKGNARNFWARYPLLLGMIQLVEADGEKYGKRVLSALHKFVDLQNSMLKNDYEGYLLKEGDVLSEEDHGWGRVRVADMMITLQWLLEHDPAGQETELWENLDYLRKGQIDWAEWYTEGVYIKEDLSMVNESIVKPLFPYEHGVNVGQGLKAGAVINRFTHNDSLIEMSRRAVDWTFKYHGAASGTVLADERLKGLGPYYGAELCTTVEAMYSLSYLYQTFGDSSFADRVELAAFNALPVALTPDWWAHQYVTQPNQPYAKELNDPNPFWNVNRWGVTYGLEPNFPCCTVNHPQGYPKFLSASFVKVGDNGLAHVLLSPGIVTTKLSSGNVKVSCITNYPFTSSFTYKITASAPFEFHIRIPSWGFNTATLSLNNAKTASSLSPNPQTGLHTLSLPSGSITFSMTLSPTIRIEHRANDSISIFSGPILYALSPVSHTTTTTPKPWRKEDNPNNFPTPIPPQSKDYEITPLTPWNIAIDPTTLSYHNDLQKGEELENPIWAPGKPPNWIEGWGCEIEWPLYKGVPGPVPQKSGRECTGRKKRVRLVPYGSAKIHMSELPTIELKGGEE
ncbi:hypothetical protein EJ08DRAFT_672097 [Tothia fuscella]|uniref:Non-reducing end beta-L-arabinofuranosidase-like GH127 catalytic domain-containing protein n=1 Tax=Tothia fuscella TaxID=1048955 RepID=A0A9P4NKL3_9PEZI|nr:hypothetical protein EJ08DRAFT_672097 [Tothia fuscella]